jgi:hypothetical protein
MSIPRSPDLLQRCLLALTLLCALPAIGQADASAERARIARERQQAEADYSAEVARCESQFIVASCVEKARKQRRTALDRLSRAQNVLDDAERKQRAAERLQRVQDKRRAMAERPAEPPPRVVQRAASAPAAPVSRPIPVPHDPRPSQAEQAEREAAYEHRLQEAAAHRREVEQRNARRAASHKPAAPLPVPSASAVSR